MALRQPPSRAPAGVSRLLSTCPPKINSHARAPAQAFSKPVGTHSQHRVQASVVADPEPEELEFLNDSEGSNADDMYKKFENLLNEARLGVGPGDVVSGLVFDVDQKGAYVDFGAKEVGFVPAAEASLATVKNVAWVLKEGEVRDFEVIADAIRRKEFAGGCKVLSLKKMELNIAWQRLRQLQENDVVTSAFVTAANRGGYIISVMGISGFLPSSHLSNPNLKSVDVMGKEIPVKLLDVDEASSRVVVSNRVYLGGARDEFKVGTVALGTVTNIKPFGAFVDVGSGVIGLLHVSQITHGRVTDIHELFSEGDRLKVMVLSYDRVRRRVSLSTKKLEPTPGDMLKDPALVYSKADEMAERFRQQVAEAEAKAKMEEERLAAESKMAA